MRSGKLEKHSPHQEFSRETKQLIREAEVYIAANREKLRGTHSAAEYFLILLEHGIEARQRGNYGIAASVVVRQGGREMIFLGHNTIFSESNPHGHAEMNATAALREFLLAGKDGDKVAILQLIAGHKIHVFGRDEDGNPEITRAAKPGQPKRELFTTLEPCPMCTVGAVVNSGIDHVKIAAADDLAGGLLHVDGFTQIWRNKAEELNISAPVMQSENPQDAETYLDATLLNLLLRMFFETREKLDDQLLKAFPVDDAPAMARAFERSLKNQRR